MAAYCFLNSKHNFQERGPILRRLETSAATACSNGQSIVIASIMAKKCNGNDSILELLLALDSNEAQASRIRLPELWF